jgi:diguanylate cyclase (GGDEF)-like protein
MPDSGFNLMYLSRSVFLVENILFLYVFLTSGRRRIIQAAAFTAAWISGCALRYILLQFSLDPQLISYLVGFLYIAPALLIFRETLQAKLFVFFMIYSLSQFTFLVFMHIDRYLSPEYPQTYVLAGMLLELAALPLLFRYVRSPIRRIIEIINLQNPVFTLFPILSFMLLAVYGLQITYQLTTFITLVLTTMLIFFSYYLIATSISGARRLQELKLISMTDSLTGLYNRRYMEKKIWQEFQQYIRTGSVFAIASADIDFFKYINDIYGHDMGDTSLKTIAKVLTESVRPYDTVARWGGEEFLILFPAANEMQAVELAERIRRRVETEKNISGDKSFIITLTLGVSVIRPDDTMDTLIKRADMALYHGKNKGRNCVVSFNKMDISDTVKL